MLNPLTNRGIRKDSRQFKQLINSGFKKENGILVPPDEENYVKTEKGYITHSRYFKDKTTINPDTGRSIKYVSAVKKESFDIVITDNTYHMSPKNKTLYDIHTDGYWIKKGTNAHKFAKGNDMIDVKKVYVSPTNQVPVSGVVFNKLLSDGYIYDPKSNTLTYPIETKKIIINRETSNNSIREIIQHNPHNVIMRFRDTTLNVPHGTESKMVKFIQRHQRYDETECTLQSTSGGDTPIFGAAFKGKQNCVITA